MAAEVSELVTGRAPAVVLVLFVPPGTPWRDDEGITLYNIKHALVSLVFLIEKACAIDLGVHLCNCKWMKPSSESIKDSICNN